LPRFLAIFFPVKLVYYGVWNDLLDDIEKAQGNKASILLAIYNMMDNRRCFGYAGTAYSAKDSLHLLIKDRLPKESFLLVV